MQDKFIRLEIVAYVSKDDLMTQRAIPYADKMDRTAMPVIPGISTRPVLKMKYPGITRSIP